MIVWDEQINIVSYVLRIEMVGGGAEIWRWEAEF